MDDLISRKAAIDAICEHGTDLERKGITVLAVANHKQVTVDLLENLPSAQPERKRGEWIEENRRPKSMMFYCSECHRTAYDPQNHHGGQKRCRYAFCPNCGAEMEQAKKGEA